MSSTSAPPLNEDLDASTSQYATFQVADLFFGVEVLKVQEVLRFQKVTRVPLAPHVVEGLINLRGEIVTALDVRRRLGIPSRSPSIEPMSIVVRTDDGPVSLLVDDIGDVLELNRELYDAPPENMSGRARELIRGVYKLDGRLLLVLDTERVVAVSEGS